MAEEKQPQIVKIDDVEYDANNFSEEQLTLFNHCLDLDHKINHAAFQLQQLNVCKESFFKMLIAALEPKEE